MPIPHRQAQHSIKWNNFQLIYVKKQMHELAGIVASPCSDCVKYTTSPSPKCFQPKKRDRFGVGQINNLIKIRRVETNLSVLNHSVTRTVRCHFNELNQRVFRCNSHIWRKRKLLKNKPKNAFQQRFFFFTYQLNTMTIESSAIFD